eukprot:tig00020903_g15080.t1
MTSAFVPGAVALPAAGAARTASVSASICQTPAAGSTVPQTRRRWQPRSAVFEAAPVQPVTFEVSPITAAGGLGSLASPTLQKGGLSLAPPPTKREVAPKMQAGGGGGGGKKGGWDDRNNRGGDGDGDDDEEEEDEEARKARIKGKWDLETLEAVLLERGMKLADLPKALQVAFETGNLDATTLNRYLNMQANPIMRAISNSNLLPLKGLAERMLADPNFVFKAAVEQVLVLSLAVGTELQARGKFAKEEIDLVVADLTAIALTNFAQVWVLAPATSIAYLAGDITGVPRVFASLPSYFLEPASPARPFSPVLRAGAFLWRTFEAVLAGAVIGTAGEQINKALVKRRNGRVSSGATSSPLLQGKNSLALAAGTATNYGPRYQLINAAEHLVRQNLIVNERVASVVLRYANSRLGEWLWLAGARTAERAGFRPASAVRPLPERMVIPKFVVTGSEAKALGQKGAAVGTVVGGRAVVALKAWSERVKEVAFRPPAEAPKMQHGILDEEEEEVKN